MQISKHQNGRHIFATLIVFVTLVESSGSLGAEDSREGTDFTNTVLPILQEHCFECHSHAADHAAGGLMLDSRSGWSTGGESGPAIEPGKPDQSLLVKAIQYTSNELQMPPDSRLSPAKVAALVKWIQDGAVDPRGHSMEAVPRRQFPEKQLWSLQPVRKVELPEVQDPAWCRNAIDHFILARLSDLGVVPNPPADRYALIRRATLDLTGLPPTLDAIAHFVSDQRPDAYERMIDRLLASPQYGERWARHWLDLARYGDSNGGDINYAYANAWRYRDGVVSAFNQDKPYDTWIREQIAGDLLPSDTAGQRVEQITATGFLALGPKMLAEVDTDKLLIDIVDEQLDVTCMTFLGLTFGCARCHDHKFDPFTTEDYYAMAGIFRSTRLIDVLRPSNGVSEWLEIDVTPSDIASTIDRLESEREQLQQQLVALGAASHGPTNDSSASLSITAKLSERIQSTTWAVWVRIDGPQSLGAVVSAAYPGSTQGHSLGFDNANTPRIVWNHGDGTHTIITASKPISIGQWHHLALTLDAASQTLRLFVDGVAVAEAPDAGTTAFDVIGVGRREASKQFPLRGDIDEVAVFDSALNDSQIQDLFDNVASDVSPLFHWSFETIMDSTVVDASSNALHGTVVGAPASQYRIDDGRVGRGFSFQYRQRNHAETTTSQAQRIRELRRRLGDIESAIPERIRVMAVVAEKPIDLPIHIRGNHLNLADQAVPRSTPKAFDHALNRVEVSKEQNGRLQLAKWIANPRHPLTARVMVNRIWQHHFGAGLVRTPSNFGTRGDFPTHPALLDWLATEFIDSGWSIKKMHQLMMNSATYRMSSDDNEPARHVDPENRLLARYPVQRLEAEAIRDSLLAVSGELDHAVGGSLFKTPNKKRVTMTPTDSQYASVRRSLYLPSIRVRGYQMFTVFDVVDNGQHVAERPRTMVAGQALFLMNNPLVVDRALRLTEQVMRHSDDEAERIDWLYRRLYARPATGREFQLLTQAMDEMSADGAAEDGATNGHGSATMSAWKRLVHMLLCANEFTHVR